MLLITLTILLVGQLLTALAGRRAGGTSVAGMIAEQK